MIASAARHRLRWLSLTPFDQSTAEGRGRERHRRVALSAAASALAKILSVGTALVSVPLTLHYLGSERFGMWMTISSLIAMLSFADFGIANGVLSIVASANGREDTAAIRRAVASGFFLLLGIAISLAALFSLAYAFVPWSAVFNVKTPRAAAEAGPAMYVFFICFAANIPLGVVQRTQMGLQQGFIASLWQCLGSVCGLASVLLVIKAEAGLPWLVLAMAGAPMLASVVNSAYFFIHVRPDLRPRIASVSLSVCRHVAGTGALFFMLQIVASVAYTSDNIVISQILGAGAVAEYAVPEKLFGLISLGVAMIMGPLWPAYGEALSRGDSAWVRRTLRRSVGTAVIVAAIVASFLLAAGPELLRLWVRDAVTPAFTLLCALAVWKVIEAGGVATAMFLNGARVIRLQLWCAVPTALVAISLKIWWVPLFGVSGAVWASAAAFLICTGVPVAFLLPRLLRKLDFAR